LAEHDAEGFVAVRSGADVPAGQIAEQPTQEPAPKRRRRTVVIEVTLRYGRRLRVDPEIAAETLVTCLGSSDHC
jgi:hypothetical protein